MLISILTFPGVIVHEAAHMLFCRLRRVAIFAVCFFRFGDPSGYVIHESVTDFTSIFLVSMGPFFVNTLLCFFFCFPTLVPMRIFGQTSLLSYFLLWVGVSIGMHAFPSTQDAGNLWSAAKQAASSRNVLALLSFPLVVAIWIANIGRMLWLDYAYGIAIGLGLPELVLQKVM